MEVKFNGLIIMQGTDGIGSDWIVTDVVLKRVAASQTEIHV